MITRLILLLLAASTVCASPNRAGLKSAWYGVYGRGYVYPSGLVAYYSMDSRSTNTVFDTFSTNNLTAGSDMAFGSSFGKYLDGADFNGTVNGRLAAPNVSALKPRTGDMSWSFWIEPDTDTHAASSHPDWISDRALGAFGAAHGFVIGATGAGPKGALQFLADTTGYVNRRLDGAYDKDSGWYHFVGIWSASAKDWTIYRNGTDITSLFSKTSSGTVGDINSPDAMTISGRPGTSDRNFDGQMDEIAIFNRALSSNEVSEIYNDGVGRFYTP